MSTSSGSHAPRASLDAMLAFAWDGGMFTSADAMAATGLTRSTAIDAMDELSDLGLLRELPNSRAVGQYSKGRPSRRFELRADAAVVVGMDAGRGHLATTVADLRGTVLARRKVDIDPEQDGRSTRRGAILSEIDTALATAGSGRDSVLAACVGVPAPVDRAGASPEHRDGFWRRTNPDIRSMLEEWVPIVRVENDASLAAVAEGAVGAAVGVDDYVTLLAGDRFGAGVVVDGRLLRGAHGGVGEMVALDHVAGVGSAHGIGFQLTSWAREARMSASLPSGHPLLDTPIDQISSRDVLDLALAGDDWATSLARRAGSLLARIASVMGSLYDPSVIIIAGGVSPALGPVIDFARDALPDGLDLPAPELVLSSLGGDAVVMGAVSGAVEAARTGVLHLGPDVHRGLRAG